MSGKLDQSLDTIMSTDRSNNRRQGRRPRVAKGTVIAKTAGISKASRNSKTKTQAVQPVAPMSSAARDGKILVSGLPSDVDEPTIKDYFSKSVGPVKKVLLTYGPTGVSRGQATVIFNKATSAVEAAQNLNGITVDGTRKIKIEVIVGADKAQAVPAKALSDRIVQPKASAKGAQKAVGNATTARAKNTKKGGRPGRGGRNAGRPKRKTADELDAEMTDYFGPNSAAATNGPNGTGGAPAASGEAMDEVM